MSTEPDENGNINCINCIDCTSCKYCISCSYCISCTSCIDCISCTDNCTNCSNSYRCKTCENCSNCNYIYYSSSCENCTSTCNYLDHCINCENCDYCVNCTGCTSCTNLIYLNSVDNINNQIGNIYTVNENYINTDTINIDPVFSFTSGNVLFTNITPNTLSINETTGNINGVISALPTVTLTYNNQEYSYTFNTNVVRVYNVNLCNNYIVYS